MPEPMCPICGQSTCVHTEAAGHTTRGAGAFREGAPPEDEEISPSILREHHAGFLRLLLLFLGAWLLVAAFIAFWAWLGK